jgi:pyruvate,orthophosphate dikinase
MTTSHATVVILDGTTTGDRELLGGKAYSVNRMRGLGLPVPPAFVLPTTACGTYHGNNRALPDDLWDEVVSAVRLLEAETGRVFGQGPAPLLVSVRSGAAQSMPGMMDTVLNLGLTPDLVQVLSDESGDAVWAEDTWHRFRRSYAETVAGDELAAPPADAWEQLRAAIGAVFDSWTNERVRAYRERHQLGAGTGTAVTVQAMVFGNRDDQSGTGVMFSRNPSNGDPELYGEWLRNAQGEDVVSGEKTPQSLDAVRELSPELYDDLARVAKTLEAEHRDLVDIEFTIESGRLFMLQCRSGKRSPQAAVRVAADLVDEGVLAGSEALDRVTTEHVESLASSRNVTGTGDAIATGLGACPGVATGRVARDLDEVMALSAEGHPVVLVRTFTAPDDVPAMFQSVGVVTEVGGATSHAALVCREIALPCVVGAGPGLVDALAGKVVTIDGSTGAVYEGDGIGTTSAATDPSVRRLAEIALAEGASDHPITRLAAQA